MATGPIFVSYSLADQELGLRLVRALRDAGATVVHEPPTPHVSWSSADLDFALGGASALVVLLTAPSLASERVEMEARRFTGLAQGATDHTVIVAATDPALRPWPFLAGVAPILAPDADALVGAVLGALGLSPAAGASGADTGAGLAAGAMADAGIAAGDVLGAHPSGQSAAADAVPDDASGGTSDASDASTVVLPAIPTASIASGASVADSATEVLPAVPLGSADGAGTPVLPKFGGDADGFDNGDVSSSATAIYPTVAPTGAGASSSDAAAGAGWPPIGAAATGSSGAWTGAQDATDGGATMSGSAGSSFGGVPFTPVRYGATADDDQRSTAILPVPPLGSVKAPGGRTTGPQAPGAVDTTLPGESSDVTRRNPVLIGVLTGVTLLIVTACVILAPGILSPGKGGSGAKANSTATATTDSSADGIVPPTPTGPAVDVTVTAAAETPTDVPATPTAVPTATVGGAPGGDPTATAAPPAPGLIADYFTAPRVGESSAFNPASPPFPGQANFVHEYIEPNVDHSSASGTGWLPSEVQVVVTQKKSGYAVRWTGYMVVPADGSYTFATVSDDGVRLSVNNTLLVEDWTVHAPTVDCSLTHNPTEGSTKLPQPCQTISLKAGQYYPITLEYYENEYGAASIQLEWVAPGAGATPVVIPASQFFQHP